MKKSTIDIPCETGEGLHTIRYIATGEKATEVRSLNYSQKSPHYIKYVLFTLLCAALANEALLSMSPLQCKLGTWQQPSCQLWPTVRLLHYLHLHACFIHQAVWI